MKKVFISYRRDDSQWPADRLAEALRARMPNPNDLFIDVDGIGLGQDFVAEIDRQVAKCDVLLALIGAHWLDARDANGGRRLDNPADFVRIEIASALKRGIPVVPVLVDSARVPKETDLPDDLRALSRRNGTTLGRSTVAADVAKLIEDLDLGGPMPAASAASVTSRQTQKSAGSSVLVWTLAAIVVIAAGAAGFKFLPGIIGSNSSQVAGAAPSAADTAAAMIAAAPTLAKFTSEDEKIRHSARDELADLIRDRRNGDFNQSLIEKIAGSSAADAYRMQIGLTAALAKQSGVVPLRDRPHALELLRGFAKTTPDDTFQKSLDAAIKTLSID